MNTPTPLKAAPRLLFAAAVILATSLSGLAQASKRATGNAAEVGLKKLIMDYYKAWNTLDPENAGRFYDEGPGLVFYDIAPLQYNGWNEYRQSLKALFTQYSSFKLIPGNDLKIRQNGRMALVTLTLHLSAVHKTNGPLELDARHTAVLEKRGGRWLIVHEHISAPLPG
ncbi:MAG TPA: nuclear transport factor 2 family protein [Blastocatellia bacterium]|jgi:ketosteroid isomerase-like protein|nr:nuclear transport factor 2 family protein [Blastocatellia bacterium]